MSDAERAARVRAVSDWYGLWLMRGDGRDRSSLRDAAAMNRVGTTTLKRWGAWLDRDPHPDTAQARAVGEAIRARRSNPRGADPRS